MGDSSDGKSAEEGGEIAKHIINLPAATERLRNFCGLDMGNLMRIAGSVQNLLQKQSQSKTIPSPEMVHTWLTNPNNIKWGVHQVPSLRTVHELLRNWEHIKKTICLSNHRQGEELFWSG